MSGSVAAERAVEYLRALLVAHGALPVRDEQLARLERRVAGLLAAVADPDDRRVLTAFATWHVLQRVRWRAEHQPAAGTATRHLVRLDRWVATCHGHPVFTHHTSHNRQERSPVTVGA